MLPIIKPMNDLNLSEVLSDFPATTLLKHESRMQFNADFPRHNRYFSNGDKPLVALVKKRGHVELNYRDMHFVLGDNEFVFFDDNVPHSWLMRDCDLEIYYYRQNIVGNKTVTDGDFCLDSFF